MQRNYTSECYGSCSSRFGLDGNKFEILDESPGKVPNLELRLHLLKIFIGIIIIMIICPEGISNTELSRHQSAIIKRLHKS